MIESIKMRKPKTPEEIKAFYEEARADVDKMMDTERLKRLMVYIDKMMSDEDHDRSDLVQVADRSIRLNRYDIDGLIELSKDGLDEHIKNNTTPKWVDLEDL